MLKRFGMFLLCLSALWACTDDDVTVVEQNDLDRMVEITINAGVDAEGSTRTFIAASGDNFWKVGDSIGVWVLNDAGGVVTGPQPYKFKVTEVKSDQTKCTLQGKVPAQYENNRLAAIYPYQADATLEKVYGFDAPYIDESGALQHLYDENYEYYLSATIPSVQTAVKDSYDPKAYISIAVMDEAGTDLNFKNACTLIKFTAPSNTDKYITAVTFETRDNVDLNDEIDYLTGKYKICYASTYQYAPDGYDMPSNEDQNMLLIGNMETKADNYKYVTLQAAEGEYFEPGETYYMVVRNFSSFLFKKGATLPESGGRYWEDPELPGVLLFYQDVDVEIYGYEFSSTPSTPLNDLIVNVTKGSPMLKSGHILSFMASDGTVCTRKFKASSSVETVTETYKAVVNDELKENETNYWHWLTKKTITTTSGVDFRRNTYKTLTFADEPSNWSGKFR